MGSKRFLWIDSLKGFLMLLVMYNHSSIMITSTIASYFNKLIFILSICYMQVFFCLSGYMIGINVIETNNNIHKRLDRLLIPYFLYGGGLVAVCIAIDFWKGKVILNDVLLNIFGLFYSRFSLYPLGVADNVFFMKTYNAPMWFLTAALTAFIFFTVYFRIQRKSMKVIVFVMYVLISATMSHLPVLLPWSLDISLCAAIFMIAGAYIKQFRSPKLLVIVFVCCFIGYLLLCKSAPDINMSVRKFGGDGIVGVIRFLLIGVFGFILYMTVFKLIEKCVFSKWLLIPLAFIGRHTIAFLCLHLLLLKAADVIINKCFEKLNYKAIGVLGFLTAITACCVISWIIDICSRKCRFFKLLA